MNNAKDKKATNDVLSFMVCVARADLGRPPVELTAWGRSVNSVRSHDEIATKAIILGW